MKRYFWLSLLLVLLLPTSSVMACSGGGAEPPISEILNRDFFVEATVLEVDELGQNAILRVERYLKGVGTAYLAVVNYTNGFYAVDQRGYDKGCNYGTDYPLFRVGERGFYGLLSQEDGSFSNRYGYGSVFYRIVDGQINLPVYDDEGYRVETLNIQEFDERVYEILGQRHEFIPDSYDASQEYPLLHPLYLYTESGRRYVIKVDRQLREIDLATEAFAVSPDGAHHAYYLDANTITFGYCSSICHYNPDFPSEEPPISAQAIAFSPNSNYVATWNESSLGLYLFDNQDQSNHGRQMNVLQFGSADFYGNLDSDMRLVSWSGDSGSLVFMDDAGIWRWHIYTLAEPELLLPAANLVSTDSEMIFEQIKFLELSQSGRYLRYGNGSNWTLLDTISGESFANAVITPDESNFIYINSALPTSGEARSNCTPPFHQSCPFAISQNGELMHIEWLHGNRVVFYFQDSTIHEAYSFVLTWDWGSSDLSYGAWNMGWMENIAASAYSNRHMRVIQRSAYELEIWYDAFNEFETYHPELFDLSLQLDSPITRLEWGQPIFYEEH
jgi:hypothetical protein